MTGATTTLSQSEERQTATQVLGSFPKPARGG